MQSVISFIYFCYFNIVGWGHFHFYFEPALYLEFLFFSVFLNFSFTFTAGQQLNETNPGQGHRRLRRTAQIGKQWMKQGDCGDIKRSVVQIVQRSAVWVGSNIFPQWSNKRWDKINANSNNNFSNNNNPYFPVCCKVCMYKPIYQPMHIQLSWFI